ncbi:transglutaminase domain-containing protein [Mycoplasmopsis cynos]|uniref:Transglutaminase-like domain-containing protein n=1 Tax=Mycoplasmopsis cynos (strain C142) TaxID=1246955 RepID=L0RW29_MYCC1|nr:transglutaminase domain-containing protein [Mycoplasmopsis cynos]CCP24357.1 Putative uncharacterized protein [Mycoplasmopsis cynos C142]
MKKKLGFILLFSSSIITTISCNYSRNSKELKDNIELYNQEKNDNKINEKNIEKLHSPLVKPKTFEQIKNEYYELQSTVQDFINNELNQLKYKTYKDQLTNIIDDFWYYKKLNQNVTSEHYSEVIQNISKAFDEVKSKYQNTPETTITNEQLEKDNEAFSNYGIKNKKDKNNDSDINSSVKTINSFENNLRTNKETLEFMNLVGISGVNEFSDRDYTFENKTQIKTFSKELIKGKQTDQEKTYAIYDWIIKNVKYAFDTRIQPAIEPFDVLTRKIAVCGGYSNLYKAMLDSVGIKNTIVIGYSKFGDHQWNLVYDSEKKTFFHSDPTWGANNPNYYNKTIEEFAKDHRAFQIIDVKYNLNNVSYEYNLGVSLFKNNENIQQIKEQISNNLNVVSISKEAFKTNEILYVGKHIERIEYESGTHNVKEFIVDPSNKYFASKDGILYNKDFTKLILAPELYEKSTITIPKTVKEIADNKSSLAIKNLKEIKVEPGNYWFSSLGGILYRNYFDKMVNKELRKIITIPSKIGPTLYISNDVILDSHNFSFNDSIENIHLQEGIKIIPEFTFNNLKNLKLIEIPASVESFSGDAFVNIDHYKLKIKVANNIRPLILEIIKKVNKNIEK